MEDPMTFKEFEKEAREAVKAATQETLGKQKYNHSEAGNLIQQINRKCISELKELSSNFKINISTFLKQNHRGGAVEGVDTCDWDINSDGVIAVTTGNEHMDAVVHVFITAL
eukprot:gb/GECG01002759.1/.p1 GENE.gb/GECG01002759.1/~~gb/GECG01002759.1/.p1  ORF type:complete len:112 (+),score=20.11 gb/GECG01002759.1/:1-336(+)